MDLINFESGRREALGDLAHFWTVEEHSTGAVQDENRRVPTRGCRLVNVDKNIRAAAREMRLRNVIIARLFVRRRDCREHKRALKKKPITPTPRMFHHSTYAARMLRGLRPRRFG